MDLFAAPGHIFHPTLSKWYCDKVFFSLSLNMFYGNKLLLASLLPVHVKGTLIELLSFKQIFLIFQTNF